PVKGLDVLLRSFQVVLRDVGRARLVLAGDGPLRASLEALARELGIEGAVSFLGDRDDTVDLIAASDLVVQASRSEVLSNAVLEAMAGSRAVIATDVGGTREIVGPA